MLSRMTLRNSFKKESPAFRRGSLVGGFNLWLRLDAVTQQFIQVLKPLH